MNSQIVTVNLVPGLSTPAVVRVSQYDVGRPILFKVMDGTMPASFVDGTIATVVGTKPSGLGFSEVAAISGNTVSLNSTLAMTQEAGMIQAEVRLSIQYGPDIGTANFILAVEKTPHAEGTTDGTQETMANLETRLQGQIDALDSRIDAIEGDQSIIDDIDALDARVTALEQGGSGLTQAVKSAMLQIAQKVAYIDEHGQTYYNVLYNALYPPAELESITAVYTQSGTVYDTDTLDSLKADLVVTANYAGGTSETVPASDYTLSGTLAEGTSTITVSYSGLTTTFNATVSGQPISDETKWTDGVAYTYTGVLNEYVDKTNGSLVTYNAWDRTTFLYCSGASTLTFECVTTNSQGGASNLIYNAFYDANKGFLSAFSLGTNMSTAGNTADVTVPSGAVYFVASGKQSVYAYRDNTGGPFVQITPKA